MIPTSDLNPLGQVYEKQFIEAWTLFEREQFEEANAISRRLILQPRISYLHKGGCHYILAHSPDDYVFHAEQALDLFKNLYPDPASPPDQEQRESQDELIKSAEAVLERARDDAKKYAGNSGRRDSKDPTPMPMRRIDTLKVRSILESRRVAS